jgi:molecular chaperone GrpE
MALAASSQPGAAPPESLRTGIDMIHGQLRSVLTDAGLQEVDANGSAFDPQLHEALCQQDSTAVPEGHVLQQVRKGYRLRDRLVRPASVIVARKPAT